MYYYYTVLKLIGVNDTLVMAAEKNAYHDDCFLPHHHLSARSMHRRFNRSVSHLFGGRTLVSWGIFAAPRHPIIMRTMANIVELIKYEYLHRSVVNLYRYDVRWKICMCTTGKTFLPSPFWTNYSERPTSALHPITPIVIGIIFLLQAHRC